MRTLALALLLALLPTGASAATTKAPTRLGVMLIGVPGGRRIATAKALGVAYARPGTVALGNPRSQDQVRASRAAGLGGVVTYVARAGAGGGPTTPPADLSAYSRTLGAAIDATHPLLAVVENEEQAKNFYAGTPAQYLAQLRVAVATAHAHHVRVTNGGIISSAVEIATWNDLWTHGHRAEADRFVDEAIAVGRPGFRRLAAVLPDRAHPARDWKAANPDAARLLATTQVLIAGYRSSAMDYVNMHWYQGSGWAFGRAARFLGRATGKTAVTNETGQLDRSPATVTSLVREAFALDMPYFIWFASDGSGGAQGLVDADGSLRPNGLAFRELALGLSSYSPNGAPSKLYSASGPKLDGDWFGAPSANRPDAPAARGR